jgi:large subunit ribosomal protein L1
MLRGKRYKQAAAKIDKTKLCLPEEALELVKAMAGAGFDETIEVAINLGVDPRKGDQMVRGITNLPHGTGKVRRIAVFAKGEKAHEAEEAGADLVGAEDLVEQIEKGWRDFDVLAATPDMMPKVGKLGRLIGPKMPNPKAGTVSQDIGKVVREIKTAARVEYRVEKAGIIHVPIGKASFEPAQLVENFYALLAAILRSKPASAKGRYIRAITVSSTMGPGVQIDPTEAARLATQ